MIDEDRLRGLSQQEIDDLLNNKTEQVNSDIEHISTLTENYFDYLDGCELQSRYIKGFFLANGIIHGTEAGYWDKIKDTTNTLYQSLSDVIKNIVSFFNGDGKKQIQEAKTKSANILAAINKLDAKIPVNENSNLLNHGHYFRAPSIENVSEDDVDDIKSAIENMNKALSALDNTKTVGGLYSAYTAIVKVSLASAELITNKITQRATDANKATSEVRSLKSPANDDTKEVKDALKQESEEAIKEAKAKTLSLRKLAALRNRFLAPTMVIIGSLSQVQALQNKTFKG